MLASPTVPTLFNHHVIGSGVDDSAIGVENVRCQAAKRGIDESGASTYAEITSASGVRS